MPLLLLIYVRSLPFGVDLRHDLFLRLANGLLGTDFVHDTLTLGLELVHEGVHVLGLATKFHGLRIQRLLTAKKSVG